MERMADEWQAIEAKNARHDTSHKLHREKPMFCMDRCVTCGLYQYTWVLYHTVTLPLAATETLSLTLSF